MATPAHIAETGVVQAPRHAGLVRITHWINAFSFIALTVSSVGILLAHPRFYWGETGYFNTPAAFELPFRAILEPLWIRAWGRNIHFLAAWVAVLNGVVYVAWGLFARHFLTNFVQAPAYNVLQKLAYSVVVFLFLPLTILSGLTLSPGFTAAFPQLFTLFGGRQSARTIHFILACVLVLFLVVHVVMVYREGFRKNVMSMIVGDK